MAAGDSIGASPALKSRLAKLGLVRQGDLVLHLPLRYEDETQLVPVAEARGDGPVLDKHCVGGLPGNRTTPIVVAIVAALGYRIPKTSSRAITSPAGTADTMEVMAPVALDLAAMRRVVEREGGRQVALQHGEVSIRPTRTG